ncbi:hypothetical protein DPSP01_014279 [Paraphaeosphaeria sporulosa]
MTGVSAQELSLRYRTDLTRPDSVTSTPVWENIHTLQGFFRDSFQSVADPSHTDPDILGQAIVPDLLKGKAPFFLQYDEWLLQQQPVPFENYFLIRDIFHMKVNDFGRHVLMGFVESQNPRQKWSAYCLKALQLYDRLRPAYDYLDKLEYGAAGPILEQILRDLYALTTDSLIDEIDIADVFQKRRRMQVHSMDDLTKLMGFLRVTELNLDSFTYADRTNWPIGSDGPFADWLDFNKDKLVCGLIYLQITAIPMLIAQVAAALGDYPKAASWNGPLINFLIGKAHSSDVFPYMIHHVLIGGNERDDKSLRWFPPYHTGDLPYTVDTAGESHDFSVDFEYSANYNPLYGGWIDFRARKFPQSSGITYTEKLFFCLQMGEMMLEWADSLYRTDETSNIARARELYKGIYWIHGLPPPINPRWDSFNVSSSMPNFTNPAKVSQIKRAQRGFVQIAGNLNFFGFSREIVPVLRYSTLKQAADKFAASAKAIEYDYLNAIQQIENVTAETFKNTAMLKHAAAQVSISDLQSGVASDQNLQGNVLVAQAQAVVAAKKSEIENHDSFSGQLGDYITGMKDIVNVFPDDTKSAVATSVAVEAGDSSASTAGLLGLGTAASVFAGMGAFWVASYITLTSMNTAQDARKGELATLESQNLPAAQAQLDIAQRSLQIAKLNQAIAAADADMANNLAYFTENRFLNAEFWSYLIVLFRRIMQQYMDLAARTGWLAERALAYELDTSMGEVRFNYYNARRRGAGSAEQLQLDLASLEGKHLEAQVEMLPIKYTISLARDFPVQFAKLRTTGKCTFQTLDEPLRTAYPGTYGHRILTVQPTLGRVSLSAPLRGLLSNGSSSVITKSDGSVQSSPHPSDALPISEFNIATTDAQLHGLPGNTLMPFEGSGVNTFWTLEFPAAANPAGLGNLADVLLTMSVQARFSCALYQAQMASRPQSLSKTLLFSARRHQPAEIDKMRKPTVAAATFAFSPSSLPTPSAEKDRKLNNVFFIIAGQGQGLETLKATVHCQTPARTIDITFKDGVTFSNSPPITDAQSTVPKSPLNVLTGIDANQLLTLTIKKANNSGVDFTGVKDVVIGVDYSARL